MFRGENGISIQAIWLYDRPDMNYIKEKVYRFKRSFHIPRFKPRFLDFHLLKVQQSCEYPEHGHLNYEVIVVGKEPYHCRLNSMELKVPVGHILVIQPGDSHQDHLKRGQEHYVLHFQLNSDFPGGEKSQPVLFRRDGDGLKRILNPGLWDTGEFFLWMERQVELFSSEEENYTASFIQDSLMETFFWQMLNLIPVASLSEEFSESARGISFQNRLFDMFESHKSLNLSVDQMAERLYMSRRNLTLLCRKYTGDPPAKAFLKYRLKGAAGDLRELDLTVQEVSERYGFSNPFHFSRAFSRVFGDSPSTYQKGRD